MHSIVVIAHNIRSTHNIGSLMRTCDGLGVSKVYLTGYTPYPMLMHDPRLPHLADRIDKQIHKTALGAEKTVDWEHSEDIFKVLRQLKSQGYMIAGLEQSKDSIVLAEFQRSRRSEPRAQSPMLKTYRNPHARTKGIFQCCNRRRHRLVPRKILRI
jgi:23S rRNA (guanosine2251-2'-O)-methyltransferase